MALCRNYLHALHTAFGNLPASGSLRCLNRQTARLDNRRYVSAQYPVRIGKFTDPCRHYGRYVPDYMPIRIGIFMEEEFDLSDGVFGILYICMWRNRRMREKWIGCLSEMFMPWMPCRLGAGVGSSAALPAIMRNCCLCRLP
jgi:hypothetical protein